MLLAMKHFTKTFPPPISHMKSHPIFSYIFNRVKQTKKYNHSPICARTYKAHGVTATTTTTSSTTKFQNLLPPFHLYTRKNKYIDLFPIRIFVLCFFIHNVQLKNEIHIRIVGWFGGGGFCDEYGASLIPCFFFV